MKNIIAYCRVSTDGQTGDDKFGIESQKKIIEEYCNNHSLNISKWVIDEGESGAKERAGFDEIVYGDATNPPFDSVIVAKSDRVARDINVYYYYKMLLTKKDITLVSIAEDFGQFGVFANMLEAFTMCVAEMERDNINKRTSGGRKIKAAKGGYSGGRPPYGYKPVGGVLEIVPSEAETVRFIIREKNDGKTYQSICNELNRQDIKTRNKSIFQPSTLQVIIENEPLYRGKYRYGKGSDWVKGIHEPIITGGAL